MTEKAQAPSTMERVRALGPEFMERLDANLQSGMALRKAVDWIQGEVGELTDVKPDTLKRALHRYQTGELRSRVINAIAGATAGKTLGKTVSRLAAVDELEKLVKEQRARVEKVLTKEATLPGGIVLKDASSEMRTLHDMLVSLAKLHLDLGILSRAPSKVMGVMANLDGGGATPAKEFEWTDEREQLFREIMRDEALIIDAD